MTTSYSSTGEPAGEYNGSWDLGINDNVYLSPDIGHKIKKIIPLPNHSWISGGSWTVTNPIEIQFPRFTGNKGLFELLSKICENTKIYLGIISEDITGSFGSNYQLCISDKPWVKNLSSHNCWSDSVIIAENKYNRNVIDHLYTLIASMLTFSGTTVITEIVYDEKTGKIREIDFRPE